MMDSKRCSIDSACVCLSVREIIDDFSFKASDPVQPDKTVTVCLNRDNHHPPLDTEIGRYFKGNLVLCLVTSVIFEGKPRQLHTLQVATVQYCAESAKDAALHAAFVTEVQTMATLTVPTAKRLQPTEAVAEMATPQRKRRCMGISSPSSQEA